MVGGDRNQGKGGHDPRIVPRSLLVWWCLGIQGTMFLLSTYTHSQEDNPVSLKAVSSSVAPRSRSSHRKAQSNSATRATPISPYILFFLPALPCLPIPYYFSVLPSPCAASSYYASADTRTTAPSADSHFSQNRPFLAHVHADPSAVPSPDSSPKKAYSSCRAPPGMKPPGAV